MTSAICTLFEGSYHYGLGALANSLYANGFRGTIWAGYRGALPPWVKNSKPCDGGTEFSPAEGLVIRFIELKTATHFTNYKADFMTLLWEKHCPQAEALFYFDPDITIQCRWRVFEEWVQAGVAVCQDVNGLMADNHPVRYAWKKSLRKSGLEFRNRCDTYFNAGFVGLMAHDRIFLEQWKSVLASMQQLGVDLSLFGGGQDAFPFMVGDQDALNIACMVTEQKISPVGQDGMDFQYGGGGWIMRHAIGKAKPWRKMMLASTLLQGKPPGRADKQFYACVTQPILVFSPGTLAIRRLDLMLASAIGRYMR